MNKFRITYDKIKETNYHYEKIKEIAEKINQERNWYNLFFLCKHFRYELNSYANSYRATTFNLQKECRTIYGDKFDKLYKQSLQKILNDEFLNIIKELRNINQKEGNLYPSFIFRAIKNDFEINFEFDLNTLDSNSPIYYSSIKRTFNKKEFSNKKTESIDNESTNEINDALMSCFIELIKRTPKFDIDDKYELKHIYIERFDKTFSLEEFVENLRLSGKKILNLYNEIETTL